MMTQRLLALLSVLLLSTCGCKKSEPATTPSTKAPSASKAETSSDKLEPPKAPPNDPCPRPDNVMKRFLHAIKTNDRKLFMSCNGEEERGRAMLKKYLPKIIENSDTPAPEGFDIDKFIKMRIERGAENRDRYEAGFEKLVELSRRVAGFNDAEFIGSAVDREDTMDDFKSVGFRAYEDAFLYFKTPVKEDVKFRIRFRGASKDPEDVWALARWYALEVQDGGEWVPPEKSSMQ